MRIPRRFTPRAGAPVSLEARADGKTPVIVGYGAVYYREGDPGTEYELWPGYVERIMPGAFDRAVREDDVRGLFNHQPSQLLGRTSAKTMRLSVDERGLRYEIDPPDTSVGRDVLVYLQRGDVTGSSFGFETVDDDLRKETRGGVEVWVREISSVRLWDTGPVTYPAYTGTEAEAEARELRARIEERSRQAAPDEVGGDLVEARARCVEIDDDDERLGSC